MLKWIASHKYFELALAFTAVSLLGAFALYSYINPPTMAREAVVEYARAVSVKVYIPGGGHGSGVVLSTDGRIVTNAHVCGGHEALIVERSDGTQVPARVVWRAYQTAYDLCLLQAEPEIVNKFMFWEGAMKKVRYEWTAARFSSARLFPGRPVFHVGNMMDIRELISFGTLGRLNSLGWNEQPAYAYVGVAGPGSSGGGVFDMQGGLVGLIYSGHQISVGGGRGFGGARIPLGVGHVLPAHMILHLLGR